MSKASEPTTLISSIFAEAESAVAEPQTESSSTPSITEAYETEHGDPTGAKRKPERSEGGRNTSLAQEQDTARALSEAERKAPRRREQSLQEAHDGVIPEAEERLQGDSLPEALQGFDPDSVSAAMVRLGLDEADLEDPRWVNALQDILESEADPDATEEEEDGAESEETEEAEKTEEEKPEEEKPAALPTPKSVEEFVAGDPAKLETLNNHVQATYQRAQAVNDPVMVDVFTQGMAKALGTSPENLPMLRNTMEILSTAGYSLVEAASTKLVPALVTEYMRSNFESMVEHFIPGLRAMHNEALISNTWSDVLAMEEFADAGLPSFDDREAFNAAAEKVHKDNPWLATWDPGPKVPIQEALRQKAILTAKLLKGETYSPAQRAKAIAEAVETGKKSATSSNRRVSAGRALKGGKTRGMIGGATEERESLMSAYVRGSGGGAI